MVEVFRTNVRKQAEAYKVVSLLRRYFPDGRINFDLEDCDKVLRVEAEQICVETVVALVTEHGFVCDVLE